MLLLCPSYCPVGLVRLHHNAHCPRDLLCHGFLKHLWSHRAVLYPQQDAGSVQDSRDPGHGLHRNLLLRLLLPRPNGHPHGFVQERGLQLQRSRDPPGLQSGVNVNFSTRFNAFYVFKREHLIQLNSYSNNKQITVTTTQTKWEQQYEPHSVSDSSAHDSVNALP